MFEHISKQLEAHQHYSATCLILSSLVGFGKRGQTWSFVFDILRLYVCVCVIVDARYFCISYSTIYRCKAVNACPCRYNSFDIFYIISALCSCLLFYLKGITCPQEAEFRAYDILLNLNEGDILRSV